MSIAADDPRHGDVAGYVAGCHEACCRAAMALYTRRLRRRRAVGDNPLVPADRLRRKVQALWAMGWSSAQIAQQIGTSGHNLNEIIRRPTMLTRSAIAIDEAYRRLEMAIPPNTPWTRRQKANAVRDGYLPPLAWDDIDLGIKAADEEAAWDPDRFDPDVIEDVLLDPKTPLRTTVAEKREVLLRWQRRGGSEAELCALTGWKPGRYT